MRDSFGLWIAPISTFIALIVGYYLGLKRTKKERLWEEKYNAYQEILNSIHEMRHWAEEMNASCLSLPTLGNTEKEEFHRIYKKARKCIIKYTDIGKLIVSGNVAKKLDELNRSLWGEDLDFQYVGNSINDLSDHAERVKKIIDGKLGGIILSAKKDLK